MSLSDKPAQANTAPQVRLRGLVEIGHRVCAVCPVLAPDAVFPHPGLFFARRTMDEYDGEATGADKQLSTLSVHLNCSAYKAAHSGPEFDEAARLAHFPASRFQSSIPTAAKTAAARVEGKGLGGSP